MKMKRFIALVLVFAVSVYTFFAFSVTAAAPVLGECDGVSGITTSDARIILRLAALLETLTDELKANADVDGDGLVTTSDARITLRVAASLTTFEEALSSAPSTTVPVTTNPPVTTTLPVTTTVPVETTSVPPPTYSPETTSQSLTMEEKMLELVNIERAAAGLKPLTLNSELCGNARVRSAEMAENRVMSHTRPDGTSCFTAVTVKWSTVGENIAAGYSTVEYVMDGWMNSPGHRGNILNSEFTQLGCAVAYDSNNYPYWTQLFIG